jgi:hypothetical protein
MSKFAAVALLVPAFFCACSSSKTYTGRDGSVTVTEKGKDQASVSISGKDGKTTLDYNTGKAITDYPSDAPIYQAKSILDMKNAEKNTRSVTLETTDAADKIADFYKVELASKGWESKSSRNMGAMTMITAEKGNRQLVIQITSDDNKRMILQHLTEKNVN